MSPPIANNVWLTRVELADRWQLPVGTLNQWASKGRGPKYALFGRHARYRLSDVIAWENEQLGKTDCPDDDNDAVPV